MRVSVIVSSFNYATFVSESIRSVLAQTQPPHELIVVDDASSDNSVNVIRSELERAPFRTELIVNKENQGQGATFNTAFDRVSGELICFLDSDDVWDPTKIERVCRFVSEYPDGGVYQHQLRTSTGLKRNGLLSADVFALWKNWDGGSFNLADAFDGTLFSPFLPTSGLCFWRSTLERVFPIPREIVICADAYLTRTATAFGCLYSIPEVLGVWRDHGENAGVRNQDALFSLWLPAILPALNEFYLKNNLGLQVTFDKRNKSFVPAGRILGECGTFESHPERGTIRAQLNTGRNRLTVLILELLRTLIPERSMQRLKRFVE